MEWLEDTSSAENLFDQVAYVVDVEGTVGLRGRGAVGVVFGFEGGVDFGVESGAEFGSCEE